MENLELDRLAAQKVMGFCYADGRVHPTNPSLGISWHPTSNIIQAFELLEWVRSVTPKENAPPHPVQGFSLDVSYGLSVGMSGEPNEPSARATIFASGFNYESVASTAPEAIVRACLKAKNVPCDPAIIKVLYGKT
jgi:hypothetical protein